jgi:L-lysine exporter family protein LysE/ArgO
MNPDTAQAMTQGWLTGASLIMAIGAQNALVLRQGLRRQHVGPVVLLCSLSDVVLICLGVFGLGAAISASPLLMDIFRLGGAAFLLVYSLRSAWRAWQGQAALASEGAALGLGSTLGSAAVMTFLNPHVYLDTVVLLGTVGAQQAAALRWAFALGACVASVMWFSMLGFGAAAVSAPLQKPVVWRVIDAAIALLMAVLGLQLLMRPLVGA